MSRAVELAKNTLIIFIGRFSTQFISLLLLSIYTFCLSTQEYGTIDLIQTYIAVLVPIISLRLDTVFFRFILEERKGENNNSKIITNGLLMLNILIVIFTVIYIIICNFVNIPYKIYVYINIITIVLSNVFMQIVRGLSDNIVYSKSCILVAITNIFCTMILFYIFKVKGETVLIASSMANTICCIYILFKCKIYKYINLKEKSKKEIVKMLKYSIPMIPDGLSWWIVSASDRIIINFFFGPTPNGIYAVSSKFSNILSSLFTIINMSWQETASMYIDDKDRDEFLSRMINNIMKITISVCILIIATMFIVFKLFIDISYIDAYKYIPILLIANIFNAISVLQGGILIAKMNTKQVAYSTVIGAAVNIILNITFVQKFGLYATSVSTLISYAIISILRQLKVKKYIKLNFEIKQYIFLALLLGITIFIYYINNIILCSVYLVIIYIIICIYNREFIKKIFCILNEKRQKYGRKI